MKVGVQFYSFKPEIDSGGFDKALNMAARCGVEGVELFSLYDIPAITYRKALNEAGVVCYGTHNHLSPLINDLDGVMAYNYTLGNPMVICHYLTAEERGTRDKWLFAAESINKAAAILKRNGFDFSYHNHDFEFGEVFDGECGMDIILGNTDPHLVGIELHIGQLPRFGLDMAEYIKKLGRRLKVLHVHTFQRDGESFDSSPAITAAKALDVEWAIVENVFTAPTDIEAVKKSIGIIRDLTRGL
ncbi:MAG: sugar phosphate isomerase/epimerase [Oscillospiraceae bacterium]|nr:sugar phosphate isomerase/epimerase [Oscillospiraceae bacterium]